MTWIKEIVIGLIEIYETRNVYELLDLLDVLLIKKQLINDEKGRFFRDIWGNEYIYISNRLSDEEERIVIAHELGHLILHTHLNTSYYTENRLLNKDQIEVQANKFAAELLIPDNVDTYEYETIQQLACYLKVSEELVKLKYKDVV
ncbi:ImmA/IrrE family metallo-endopeptidase [Proteiniborus sp.]|uniref:ImmA/IrrE family metallo-endopeptidase n=1 Tax=Proteiniborus sp. TaxID=2079015 RepID=UPI00331DF7CA